MHSSFLQKKRFGFFHITFLVILNCIVSCSSSYNETLVSLDDYEIETGFELEVLAAEPLLRAPVAMSFDDSGRIWVVEMPGYMSNMEGFGEEEPNGSIKILQDLDKDGGMDHAKIFLDSLVLPRAISHVYGGLLYAEPPYLYFTEINNDRPMNRVVVDSLYAAEGNPEHQPNGLVMNIDNWIYSAKSNFRYRRWKGVWLKEPTTFRGQWGISKDNFGRLYYNNNATQLIADYVLPNRMVRNDYVHPMSAVNQIITEDQRVYPLQATLVNRGYINGVLNSDSLLVNVTASCGPLVYRGGAFPLEYNQNAFVCIPEANLIKRNLLTFHGDSISAKQAWEGKEFLASLDQAFRPVSLVDGPDGSMYIVDMHKGVIQHRAYASPYYKKKARASQIDTVLNYGRILKVSASHDKVSSFKNQLHKAQLLNSLNDNNGWIRDRAQQKLIMTKDVDVIPSLVSLLLDEEKPLAQLHALYVLEGIGELSFEILEKAAHSQNSQLVAHVLVQLEQFISVEHRLNVLTLFESLMRRNDTLINLYLGSSLGHWAQLSEDDFFPLLDQLLKNNPDNPILNEAILSGLSEREESFLAFLQKEDARTTLLKKGLDDVIANKATDNKNQIFKTPKVAEDNRTKGAKLFRQICAACHGINGKGINGLAPPLEHSEYVSEPVERLALIILHGVTGPIHVKGELYKLNQSMPGLLANDALSDKDIAGIISYVTNGFSDNPQWISPDKIKELRNVKSKSGGEFTEPELLELY
ncbi:MAG: mono/diheme cytochrome c family protein [Maribacter sp.]|jgi:mono/diheme cytochrome c family protein